MARASLYHVQKLILKSGLLREIVVWKVATSKKYPDGIKYRLALVDPFSRKLFVLFDNHFPKGHHRHDSDGKEHNYHFSDLEVLVNDYLKYESLEESKYENNEN